MYFLVSLAVFISASGWLGDRFGGKRVLLAAIAVFTIASALCGMARSLTELDIFRVLEAPAALGWRRSGWRCCSAFFLRRSEYPHVEHPDRADHAGPCAWPGRRGSAGYANSWPWVFYVNVPLGILAITFGALFLEGGARCSPARSTRSASCWPSAGLGLLVIRV